MPYSRKRKRNYSRKRRNVKRRRTAKRAYGLAKKAYKLAKQDFKHHDIWLAQTDLDFNNPIVALLNGIGQGDEEPQRDGDTITMLSMSLRFVIDPSVTVSANVSIIRVLIFRWEPHRGAGPTVGDLFTDVTQQQMVFSHYNWENKGMFHIYYDKRFIVSNVNNSKSIMSFNVYKKLNFKTTYNFVDGTVTSIQKNSLWMMAFSNDISPSPFARLTCNMRVHFLP